MIFKSYLREFLVTLNSFVSLLTPRDKSIFYALSFVSTFIALLDVVGILLFAVLIGLIVSGINFQQMSEPIRYVVQSLGIESLTFTYQVLLLSLITCATIMFRLGTSIAISILSARFLGSIAKKETRLLARRVMSADSKTIALYSKQEWMAYLTKCIHIITVRYPLLAIGLLGDVLLAISIMIPLIVIAPGVAALSFLFLFCVLAISTIVTQKKARELTSQDFQYELKSTNLVDEILENHETLKSVSSLNFWEEEVARIKNQQIGVQAKILLIPTIGKYVFEASVIVGLLLVAGSLFYTSELLEASSTLALFAAALSRIAPAVLRMQNAALQIRNGWPYAKMFRDVSNALSKQEYLQSEEGSDTHAFSRGIGVQLINIWVKFPNRGEAVKGVDLTIDAGTKLLVTGISGSGKSTLLKVFAGLIKPDKGEIRFYDERIDRTVPRNSIRIGYVPQECRLFSGTVRHNILLGRNLPDSEIWKALEKVDLVEFVKKLPLSLDTKLDMTESKLSGGQKQRISIARAILAYPKILVLDEITSSLDKETDLAVIQNIVNLDKRLTIIMASHKEIHLNYFNKVVNLQDGLIRNAPLSKQLNKVQDFKFNNNGEPHV